MSQFEPNRSAALHALSQFVPRAGRDYAGLRNYDLGPGAHSHVSCLSPYIRHRVITEQDVLTAVLGRYSPRSAEKFVQEVFWRTYWKGWLEMRPSVWHGYRADLQHRWDDLQTQSGLRANWQSACEGKTGIACFDAWAKELVQTGYLHNHARMWFASIWVFTLRLPWELGADFFLRHLLDGDPASNTLGWRWVAGLQTRGWTYLARPDNIQKYTQARFCPAPGELALHASPVEGRENPEPAMAPQGSAFDPDVPTAFVLHSDDLSPGWLFDMGLQPMATALLAPQNGMSPLISAPNVHAFRKELTLDAATRWSSRLGEVTRDLDTPEELENWALSIGAKQIVSAYAPVGPVADVLDQVHALPVVRLLRDYDADAWPHARAGFFKFKDKIPKLLGGMKGLNAA